MSTISIKIAGIILLTVPSIAYGGYFLLTVLSGKREKMALTDFQKSMFRAGHAHAGVLVILSLITTLLGNYLAWPPVLKWATITAFPLAAILVSGGFFAAAIGPGRTRPGKGIRILFAGAAVLVFGLLSLGLGLLFT